MVFYGSFIGVRGDSWTSVTESLSGVNPVDGVDFLFFTCGPPQFTEQSDYVTQPNWWIRKTIDTTFLDVK